ncbi:MAG: hypothetical protein KDJ48_13400 [Nitratireductor sp.]|nr:hypothetical protein [Nitratireductor sp.]MCB1460231.1 hypothetical protein [Nitratireductor sp.]
MFDTILYRRFALVTALIAALGVLGANLVQETRSPRILSQEWQLPAGHSACMPQIHCDNMMKSAVKLRIG